ARSSLCVDAAFGSISRHLIELCVTSQVSGPEFLAYLDPFLDESLGLQQNFRQVLQSERSLTFRRVRRQYRAPIRVPHRTSKGSASSKNRLIAWRHARHRWGLTRHRTNPQRRCPSEPG